MKVSFKTLFISNISYCYYSTLSIYSRIFIITFWITRFSIFQNLLSVVIQLCYRQSFPISWICTSWKSASLRGWHISWTKRCYTPRQLKRLASHLQMLAFTNVQLMPYGTTRLKVIHLSRTPQHFCKSFEIGSMLWMSSPNSAVKRVKMNDEMRFLSVTGISLTSCVNFTRGWIVGVN